jgi:magnesium chelatase family protein
VSSREGNSSPEASAAPSANGEAPLDLADVRGQSQAKRALEVAAAGRHNLLLTGPPGAGKTMLAQRLPGILPPLTMAEAVEVSRVHSSAGLLGHGAPARAHHTPPLRQPHHTGSEAGILGGGPVPRPGEVSLAHNGVLFLDELPEFRRSVLEALRQPLEEGFVTISRARGSLRLPARFQLVAAHNPCPCGEYGTDGGEACRCTHGQVRQYQARLSGPLLDRIDLRVSVPRLSAEDLLSAPGAEPSTAVRARVKAARHRMLQRQGCPNAQLTGQQLRQHAEPVAAAAELLNELASHGRLSGRGFDRLLRVARTVADLEESAQVEARHLAEAAAYRHRLKG